MRKAGVFFLIAALLLSLGGCAGFEERPSRICGICGQKYYEGDANGNYKKIESSGLCKICFGNETLKQKLREHLENNEGS